MKQTIIESFGCQVKRCTSPEHSQWLVLGDFYISRRTTSGRTSRCKWCCSNGNRESYSNNPDPYKVRALSWESNNRDRVRSNTIVWKMKNPEYGKEWNRNHPEQLRRSSQLRRSRLHGCISEKFLDVEIFERDGWICGTCKKPIDPDLRWPNPMSVSLDHIWPVSLGGPHIRANVQTTHLRCNIQKSNTMDPIMGRYIW